MIEGTLGRWKWLLPRMSYRERTLIINNLVASTLWHRLASLEPPVGLLSKIKAIIVDFFLEEVALGSTVCFDEEMKEDKGLFTYKLEKQHSGYSLCKSTVMVKIIHGRLELVSY